MVNLPRRSKHLDFRAELETSSGKLDQDKGLILDRKKDDDDFSVQSVRPFQNK